MNITQSQNTNSTVHEERRRNAIRFAKKIWKDRIKDQNPKIRVLQVLIPLWILLIGSLLAYEFGGLAGLIGVVIILTIITLLLQPIIRKKFLNLFISHKIPQDVYKLVEPWKDSTLFLDETEKIVLYHDKTENIIKGVALFRLMPAKKITQNLYGFYRSCYYQGIPIFWGHYVVPKTAKDIKQNVTESFQYEIETNPEMDIDLENVGGIWEMSIIVGTQIIRKISNSLSKTMEEVKIETLRLQSLLDGMLAGAFPHAAITTLSSDNLIDVIHSLSLGGSLPSFFTSLLEAITFKLIHDPSFAKEKSMRTHIPAEFNVPTYLTVDIPIGYILEQEFMKYERLGGLSLNDLFSNVLITGGNPNERFQVITRMLSKACELDLCTIMLTTSDKYRNLLDFIPSLRIIRLGTDSALKIFQTELSNNGDYMTLLTESMAAIFNLSPSGAEHLERILMGFQETKSDSLEDFIGYVALEMDNITRQLSWKDQESFRTIQNLFGNLIVGKGADFFGGWQIPMHKLLKQPIIFEISLESITKKRFALYLLIIKILFAISGLNYMGGLIFVEEARLLVDNTNYRSPLNNYLPEIIEKLNQNGFGLICELPRPSLFDETVLGMFKNIISFKIGPEQVKYVSKLLQLITLQEGKFSSRRHSAHHYDFLINMEPQTCLLKLPDQPESFPMFIPQVKNLREVNTWTDDDIDLFLSDDEDVMEFHEHSDRPMISTTLLKNIFSSRKELDHAYLILLKTYQNQDLNIDSISIADQIYYDLLDTGEIQEHERAERSRLIKLLVLKLANHHFLKGEQVPAGNHTIMKYTITEKGMKALEEHENMIKQEV